MGQIRPPCQAKDCKNEALIYAYGKFLCGNCIMKIQNKLNKRMLDLL